MNAILIIVMPALFSERSDFSIVYSLPSALLFIYQRNIILKLVVDFTDVEVYPHAFHIGNAVC
ncbi:unnamed protein product [Brugia timori]|uniref:Secreted protein n=1 Tax=Brugia timori TaxID=42155 RepID=A0A0R3QCA6_9BILA|nr:unnamed protein product [Brugia timori]